MLNFYKLIEILVCLQSLVITTMLPVYIPLSLINKTSNNFEIPVTWQIPTIILLTLIFNKKVVFRAFSIYLILGLFIFPVFHQGGSIGYLLTPNFGYLLGLYPLIKIINNLNNKNKINVGNFLKNGFIAIGAKQSDILIEFLIEALILSTIGGLIGTTTGLSGVFLLSLITPLPASVGITTTFSTMIISGSIGLIFGVLPAKRASKLDPIVALRSL